MQIATCRPIGLESDDVNRRLATKLDPLRFLDPLASS